MYALEKMCFYEDSDQHSLLLQSLHSLRFKEKQFLLCCMAIMYIQHRYETLINVNFVLLEMTALTWLEAEAVPRP